MSTLQTTDLFPVTRGTNTYKVSYQDIVDGASKHQQVTMSATPPTTPVAGDLWFNSNKSTLYAFYNDGSSSQWVSV